MEDDNLDNRNVNIKSADEIVIVLPESAMEDDEIEINLDELGIDLEALGDNVNIVVQIEGADADEGLILDGDDGEEEIMEPNEWYFDDDAYEIVYYEFPDVY